MCKICEKYPYNAGPARGAFSVRPCVNTEHPTHAFKQHEKSGIHQRLEKKLYKSENELKEALQRAELSLVEKAKVNTLYITKCIHTIHYLIRKNIAVNTNYADLIRFFATELQEPITKQYLNTCPKNAIYTITMAAKSLLAAMNIYFEKLNMREIKEACFLCLYPDEAESSRHKENFSMFLNYLSLVELKVKTTFFGIVNLNRQTAAQVMDIVNQFFLAKNITLDKMLFSVLDGTNTMSGKKNGLERRIRNFSLFNIYINYRNHRLALCLPHFLKNIEYAELLLDYDAVLLGVRKMFRYSPKKELYRNQFKHLW